MGRLMIVIAVVGVGFGIEGLRERSRDFAAMAEHFSRLRRRPDLGLCGMAYASLSEGRRREVDREQARRILYYSAMEQFYDQAARHPWLASGPVPAAPDRLTEAFGELTSAEDW